jgi:hypothetical protein
MSDTRRADPRSRPLLPRLPANLQGIWDYSVARPQDSSSLIRALDHAGELIGFVSELCGWVTDKTSGRDRTGLGRELEANLTSSELRRRVCVLSYLCVNFKCPPTPTLLDLMFAIDGPEGVLAGSDGVRSRNAVKWEFAVRLYAYRTRHGRKTPVAPLARTIHVPLSTLRGWMETDEWAYSVKAWREVVEHGRAPLTLHPDGRVTENWRD